MKTFLLIIFAYPFFLFGQNPIIDTTCVCGQRTPSLKIPIIVEDMAEYPGGFKSLKSLIATNVNPVPNENGKIQVSFVINCKGNTCGLQVIYNEGISPNTESKIVNSLKEMKIWKPAKQMNRPIDIPFQVSIIVTNGILSFDGFLK